MITIKNGKMKKLSENNIIKLYHYLCRFEKEFSQSFGCFDFKNKKLCDFCIEKSILLGSMCKTNKEKFSGYKYFILFNDRKPERFHDIADNDSVYNLLCHIRNSIAHGLVIAENRQKFNLTDYNKQGKLSMKGKISNKLLYELIDILISTHK